MTVDQWFGAISAGCAVVFGLAGVAFAITQIAQSMPAEQRWMFINRAASQVFGSVVAALSVVGGFLFIGGHYMAAAGCAVAAAAVVGVVFLVNTTPPSRQEILILVMFAAGAALMVASAMFAQMLDLLRAAMKL